MPAGWRMIGEPRTSHRYELHATEICSPLSARWITCGVVIGELKTELEAELELELELELETEAEAEAEAGAPPNTSANSGSGGARSVRSDTPSKLWNSALHRS